MFQVALTAVLVASAGNVEADFVIRGVTIYDGTGGGPIQGDIAVRGDQIVALGEVSVRGMPREIHAQGLFATPGFIDLHNHSDRPILEEQTRENRNYLTQGVTTIVTGNCGGGHVDVAEYLGQVDQDKAGTNVAHLIPHGSLRKQVMGGADRPASPEEIEAMSRLVRRGMEAGAFGMSTGLIYVPSKYADTGELVELATIVGQNGGIYVSHMRNENTGLLDAIEETLMIGRTADLPVHISHFKASGRAAWGLAAVAVQRIQVAREEGQRVTADQYPYIASSTSLGAMVVPDRYREADQLAAALDDPAARDGVLTQISDAIEQRQGGSGLFIASYAANPDWQGRSLADLSRELGRSVLELVLEIQRQGGAQMVNFGMSEEEVRLIMQQPFVAVASDGGAKLMDQTVPHPRNYGTFPRKIGEYAIRRQIVSVDQAIFSATGLPARILSLEKRGRLRVGDFADVVVFDPETLIDHATFEQPHQYSAGVRFLFVNGQLAIDDGRLTGALAGRSIRRGE